MAERINALTDQAIAELRRDHRKLQSLVKKLEQRLAVTHGGQPGGLLHGVAASIITAKSGSAPGQGTATIQRWNSTGTTLESDSDWTETVYNKMDEIPAGSEIELQRDLWGRLFVIESEC